MCQLKNLFENLVEYLYYIICAISVLLLLIPFAFCAWITGIPTIVANTISNYNAYRICQFNECKIYHTNTYSMKWGFVNYVIEDKRTLNLLYFPKLYTQLDRIKIEDVNNDSH